MTLLHGRGWNAIGRVACFVPLALTVALCLAITINSFLISRQRPFDFYALMIEIAVMTLSLFGLWAAIKLLLKCRSSWGLIVLVIFLCLSFIVFNSFIITFYERNPFRQDFGDFIAELFLSVWMILPIFNMFGFLFGLVLVDRAQRQATSPPP
jgi:hypothetical protein